MSGINDPLLDVNARLGKDRRRFLIVSIFDVCCITLLWLICTVTKGEDWSVIFYKEINIFEPYFLKNSLFDIVIIAVCRMLVVLFFYAYLVVSSWIPVAGTTGITTVFLVLKILFFFSPAQGSLPQYLVILSSFAIAWFELWLLPFRVLSRERQHYTIHGTCQGVQTSIPIRNVLTEDEFGTAIELSSGSDTDSDRRRNFLSPGKVMSSEQYLAVVSGAELTAKRSLEEIDNWKIVSKENPEIRFCRPKSLYYLCGEMACSPESLFRAVWTDNRRWNRHIVNIKVLLNIGIGIDVIRTVTAPAMRGYIRSRDFVDVRKMRVDKVNAIYEGFFVSVHSSIHSPDTNVKIVRGSNGPNLVRVAKSPTSPLRSRFEWIIDNDIKGNIPKSLVERTFNGFLCEYYNNLKKFILEHPNEYP